MTKRDKKSAAQDAPEWDEAHAAWLVGKSVLVGVAWVGPDGETVTGQDQYHGRVAAADREAGITIACEGARSGETLTLPPATAFFTPAAKGEYRFRDTGEVVSDPDVVSRWSLRAKPKTA